MHTQSRRFAIFLSILLGLAVSFMNFPLFAGEAPHPFSVHDMLAMKRIGDPNLSPDGKRIVFVVRETDLKANRGRTDLYLLEVSSKQVRRLTTHPAADFNPRWSPDNHSIYFLSTRSGSSQVWKIAVDGGEAVPVTHLPLDVTSFSISPDGSRLVASVDVFPDCPDLACTANRLKERKQRKATGVLYDHLFVRHWDTWKDGRRSHLIVVPLTGGEPVDIMKGMDADCPSKPFGGPEEYTFTPDESGIVFATRVAGRSEPWSTNFDLYLAPADGSQPPANLTADNPAWDTLPVFSPDGKTLAYLAMKRAGYESDRFRIVLMNWHDRTKRVLTEAWDRSPRAITWTPDGKHIIATAQNLGQVSLFKIDVQTGQVTEIWHDGTVSSPAVHGNTLYFGLDNLKSPVELYRIRLNGKGLEKLTGLNDTTLSRVKMGDYEQFTFPGWKGETVYAYIVKPVDFDPNHRYPVAFLIHGGPQGSFGNHFHYRWNPQAYAGAGYAAVMVDFHGSTGYGQRFTDSIRGDWGGKPFVDLKKGLATALKRYPWMDGQRVCALGASYGGYMINWIAGNWPNRFRCLVNHDGVFDMRSMYFSTEELWFPEWEHGGPYWKNPKGHEKHNPARFVARWKTPMLVIHGGRDYRVPLEQGLSAFTALQRQGIPSEFLYFPDENHWVLKPQNSIQWHETVLGWLDRWLKSK